jgi:WD40-like Beta Propeller Repeat
VARLILALTTTALVVAAASPDRAHASFPGENGRFLFIVTGLAPLPSTVPPLDPVEDGFFFGNRLATANKRGRDVRLLPTCIECEQLPGDWSPNGRRIVYAEDEAGVDVRLVTTRPDGTKRKAVYRARRGILSSPVWSPNGRRIAFVWHRYARRGRGSDIYVIRRDGTHLTRVTRTGRNVKTSIGRAATASSFIGAPASVRLRDDTRSSRSGPTGSAFGDSRTTTSLTVTRTGRREGGR